MSCTTMNVFKDNVVHKQHTYRNAHGGAMAIWCIMSEQFLGEPYSLLGDGARLWALADDPSIPWYARVAMLSTFDRVVFKREDLGMLATAFELFTIECAHEWLQTKVYSIKDQAEDARKASEAGAQGVSWNQTSVCSNFFNGKYDEETDEEIPFRLDQTYAEGEKGHWYADLSFTPGGQ